MSQGTPVGPSLSVRFEYELSTSFGLIVNYTPRDTDGHEIPEWAGQVAWNDSEIPTHLRKNLETYFRVLSTLLPLRSVEFPNGSQSTPSRPSLTRIIIWESTSDRVHLYTGRLNLALQVERSTLPPDLQRLWSDVILSIEAECWKDLQSRTEGAKDEAIPIQIFISYRKRPGIEQFAEALAERIEQERIRIRFDKWDMLPGDSLPGKIAEAFEASNACVIILSSDFQEGAWATAEMNTAITKAVTEGYRVIPLLYDDGPIPELLKHLIRVDFRDHESDAFEEHAREVIGGILGLTRRPFP